MTPHVPLRAAILIALSAGVPAAVGAQAPITTITPGVLTVCTFTGFPPSTFITPSGRWAGLDARFVRRFAASQALTVDARVASGFDGIWRRPAAGECDMASSAITVTDVRRADSPGSTWTQPYHSTLRAFVVRRGAVLTGVRGLAGKTVLVAKGTTAEQDVVGRVRAAGVRGVRIRYSSGEVAARRAVRTGAAFAYESDDLSARQAVRNDPSLAMAWLHPRLDAKGRNATEPLSFVVRDASTGLLPALNAFITANKGSYAG